MEITTIFAYKKTEIIDETVKLIYEKYKISFNESKKIKDDICLGLNDFCTDFIEELDAVIEYPYVDKMFRDSYYNYYSFKLDNYPRNTIRISFFDSTVLSHGLNSKPLDMSHFLSHSYSETIQQAYRGFLIIRPTLSNIIGRNVISPTTLKNKNISIRGAEFSTTVCGLKLKVWGFPHSSQDESISCSEATLWACMEYFSNSYPEYKPSLPSNITSILKMVSFERQTPSNGLTVSQLSYALREFGFDPKIYTKDKYGAEEFYELFSCYIESGIPLIVAVEGKTEDKRIRKKNKANTITSTEIEASSSTDKDGVIRATIPSESKTTAHAFLCIGRENLFPESRTIEDVLEKTKVPPYDLIKKQMRNGSATIYDNDKIVKDYVYIDDNSAPYIRTPIAKPPVHIGWKDFSPTHFIVPLYKRVHLTAGEAKELIYQILLNSPYRLENDSEIFLRVFLTSSRSFKDQIIKNETLDDYLKQTLLKITLPKFIWVGETSDINLLSKNQSKANGLILLDATEADTKNLKPLIFTLIQNKLRTFAPRYENFELENGIKVDNSSPSQYVPDPFEIYNYNLKDIKKQ